MSCVIVVVEYKGESWCTSYCLYQNWEEYSLFLPVLFVTSSN